MADVEDEIRDLKNHLFGSLNGAPRGLIELLYKHGASGKPVSVVADWTNGKFVVYWLDGQLFRGLQWIGFDEAASASEFAFPVSTLTGVQTEYDLHYDGSTGMHDRWDRKVTFKFPDAEPIVIDVRVGAMQDNNDSQFVDAVLSVIA